MRTAYRSLATYIGKVAAGAKPGDLPVSQPTQFELVVNLKTAKALGVALPQAILLSANEVIQQAPAPTNAAQPAREHRLFL